MESIHLHLVSGFKLTPQKYSVDDNTLAVRLLNYGSVPMGILRPTTQSAVFNRVSELHLSIMTRSKP